MNDTPTKTKNYKPNYRCIVPGSAHEPSGCPDFFLPYKDDGCAFRCPTCGTQTILPLF